MSDNNNSYSNEENPIPDQTTETQQRIEALNQKFKEQINRPELSFIDDQTKVDLQLVNEYDQVKYQHSHQKHIQTISTPLVQPQSIKQIADNIHHNIDYNSKAGLIQYITDTKTQLESIDSRQDYKSITIYVQNSYIFQDLIKQIKDDKIAPARITESAILGFGFAKLYHMIKPFNIIGFFNTIRYINRNFSIPHNITIPFLSMENIRPNTRRQTTDKTSSVTIHSNIDQHSEFINISDNLGLTIGDLAFITLITSFNIYYQYIYYKNEYMIFYTDDNNSYLQRIKKNIEQLYNDIISYTETIFPKLVLQLDLAKHEQTIDKQNMTIKEQIKKMETVIQGIRDFLRENNLQHIIDKNQTTIEQSI